MNFEEFLKRYDDSNLTQALLLALGEGERGDGSSLRLSKAIAASLESAARVLDKNKDKRATGLRTIAKWVMGPNSP